MEGKLKYLLHIHIFASDNWPKYAMAEQYFEAATIKWHLSEIFKKKATSYWGHGVLKVKNKSMLHIYRIPIE